MTYLALYGLLLLSGAVTAGKPAARNLFYWTALIGLFVFVAFRYQVGCDWTAYLGHYEAQRFQPFETALDKREPGYWLIVNAIHVLKLEYPYVNVVMGAFFFVGLHALARRQPDPAGFLILSLPLMIINLPMSAIRQAAGLGFLCLAYNAFVDQRVARFVAFVLAGSLFHSSAAIFVMLTPFIRGGLTPQNVVVGTVLGLPGGYYLFQDDFEFYADRYLDSGIDAFGGPFRAGLLALVGLFFLLQLRNRWFNRFRWDYDLTQIGSFAMLATFPIALASSVIGDRIGYYIMPLQLMVLARLPYLYEGRDAILLYTAPYVGLGAVLWVWTEYSTLYRRCYMNYASWLFS